MSDKIIEKYLRPSGVPVGPRWEPDVEESVECGCFLWLRGMRERAVMLELRKKDGHILAVGYSWIERVEFEPDKGITLHLPGRQIRIKGSGLNAEVRPAVRLFDGIIRHRVPWIRESDRPELLAGGEGAVVIESIEWDG